MNNIPEGMTAVEEVAIIFEIDEYAMIDLIKDGLVNGECIDGVWYISIDDLIDCISTTVQNDEEVCSDKSSSIGFWASIGIVAILGKIVFLIAKGAKVAKVATVAAAISYSDEVIDVAKIASRGIGSSDEVIIGVRSIDNIDESLLVRNIDELELQAQNTNKLNHTPSNKLNFHSINSVDSVKDISRNELSKEQLEYFTHPSKYDVAHFISIPSDEASYYRIFSKKPQNNELNQIRSTKSKLSNQDNVYIAQASDENTIVKQFLKNTDSEYVTFTGHNEDGLLMLPKGGKIKLHDVAQICVEFAKKCVFLSCKSKNYISPEALTNVGVSKDLSYTDALSLIEEINKKSKKTASGNISYDEFSTHIAKHIDKKLTISQYKSQVVFHVKVTGKVTGIGAVSYKLNEYFGEEETAINDKE